MRRQLFWLGICVAIGCAQELPSTVPLGAGPRAEPDRGETEVASAKPHKPAPPPEAETPDTGAPLDAGSPTVPDASLADTSTDAGTTDASDAAPDAASVVFAGLYAGSDVTIFRVTGVPERTEPDPNAKTRVEQRAPDRIAITLVNSRTGDPICTLDATVSGNVGTLTPGQTCFSEGVLVPNVVSGQATVTDRRLVFDMELTFELSAGDRSVSGRISYHFDGTRP
jgi:hypothetical protein